jgi:DNA-binding transcriptional LysR family regulator
MRDSAPRSSSGLDDLALFVAVVRHGGLRPASTTLGIPRSTISRRLTQLEDTLGVRLLERNTARVELTASGAEHFARIAEAVDLADVAVRSIRDEASEPRGTLRIAASHVFAEGVLVPVTARYLERYPRTRVELLLSPKRIDLVVARVDIAFRTDPLGSPSDHAAKRLADSVRGIFASPAYVARHGLPARAADFANHALLSVDEPGGEKSWTFAEDGKRITLDVSFRVQTPSFTFVTRACVAGLGIARLPMLAVADELAAGRLVPILESHWSRLGVFALFPTGRRAMKTRAYLDLAAHMLRSQPGLV